MSGTVLGREHWYGALARRWNHAWGDDSDPAPTIYVREAGGHGWWVVVEPYRTVTSVYFHDHAEAAAHAQALKRLHGWSIHSPDIGDR